MSTSRQQSANFTLMPHVFEVVAGTTLRDRASTQPFQRVRVASIHINPRTVRLENGQMDWDMALLRLARPLTFGDYVQPICLPGLHTPPPTGQLCYLAGWGFINPQEGMLVGWFV